MEPISGKPGADAHQSEPEQPGTASDHNNSMITAVSADRDHDSPITSPIIHRTGTAGNGIDAGDKGQVRSDIDVKFDEVIDNKSNELIKLMKEIVDSTQLKDDELDKFIGEQTKGINDKKFDWKNIVDVSEKIFNDYSKEMESISKEFDEFNKVRLYHLSIFNLM